MRRVKQSIRSRALLAVLFAGVFAHAQSPEVIALRKALSERFTLTQTTPDRSDIATPGTKIELRVDGLWMYSITASMAPESDYKHGRISIAMGHNLFSMMSSGQGLQLAQHRFLAGDMLWVTGIDVPKDGVRFHLYSDPIQGTHYFGNLKIVFPGKDHLPDTASVLALVPNVLAPAATQPVSDAQAPAAPPQPAAPAAPAVSYQDLPAPPPPAPTVTLGMSRAQVIGALGEPAKKAEVGTKEILVYSGMKITLTKGAVTAIE